MPCDKILLHHSGGANGRCKVTFGGGRYLLSHRLGNGSFGDIFEGVDMLRHIRVAVKLEKKAARYPQLEYESKVYRVLHQSPVKAGDPLQHGVQSQDVEKKATRDTFPSDRYSRIVVGIPTLYYYDSEGDYNILVMELCGPSLEDLFNYCHRRFSLKTVLMIAEQMLHRIQYLHERGFVHRDIKPENFTLGSGIKSHILYVIDFGLSKLYWDCRKNTHIPFVEGKPLTGTARYCSVNTHRGYEQSRRDDLESVGYLFVYFLRGSLPWQGILAKDQQLKAIKIGDKKASTSLEELCEGLPSEFLAYSQYCRNLSFQHKPDYEYLRGLFRSLAKRSDCLCDTTPGKIKNKRRLPNAGNDLSTESHSISQCAVGSALAQGPSDSEVKDTTEKEVRNVDPTLGYYDWMFDWLLKRDAELGAEGGSQVPPSATPAVHDGQPQDSIDVVAVCQSHPVDAASPIGPTYMEVVVL